MRTIALFLFSSLAGAQMLPFPFVPQAAASGTSTYLQGTSASTSPNTLNSIQGSCGASFSASCTVELPQATTAHGELAFGFLTGNSSAFVSAYTCTSSSGCTSGNAIDTFTNCTGCAGNDATYGYWAVAYVANEVGGATYMTVTFGTVPTGQEYVEILEVLPPFTGSYDTASFSHSDSCGSCSLGNVTLAGTDDALCFMDTETANYSWTAPYRIDEIGNLIGLDLTSGTGPSFDVVGSSGFMTSCVYFKSSGGSYVVPAQNFTEITTATSVSGYASNWLPTVDTSANCSPTCTITLLANTANAGDLLEVDVGHFGAASGAKQISSVTGACSGSWVVPSGAGTCQNSTVEPMSCAYCLSSTSGASSFSVTLAANDATAQFDFHEIHRTTGTWAEETQSASENSSGGTILPGQSVSLSANSVCFERVVWNPASAYGAGDSLMPFPSDINLFWFNGGEDGGFSSEIINTTNGSAGEYIITASTTKSESAKICFD